MTTRPHPGRLRPSTRPSTPPITIALGSGGAALVRFSERADGDFHIEQPADQLHATQQRFVGMPWSQPDEVHGAELRTVSTPGGCDGAVCDALVTDCAGAVIGIWVGDCAPVALVSASGRIAGVHAGWRGLEAGVLQRTVVHIRRSPDEEVAAVLGPCIHPCCYEFGGDDLARLVRRLGPSVVGTTSAGRRALDMRAAVRAALAEVGVRVDDRSECTACGADRFFSHRARGERGRQVMAMWKSDGR